jgi:predicted NBD/HSP70 family sugar kinase
MALLSNSVSAGDVLALIVSNPEQTRSTIGRATGLSRSTIAERLEVLFEAGLIRESSEMRPSGGRPSKTITLNHSSRLVLAADLGEDHIRLVVTDLAAMVCAETVAEIAVADGPEVTLNWIATEGKRLVESMGRKVEELLGLGLSVPAPVDFARGQVVAPSVMTGWDGVDIEGEFRKRLDIPVLVENDVNARGLGEFMLAWRTIDHVLYVKAGTGIGSAILTGGALFRGAQGAAGDIGHIRLDPVDGPLCRCGAIGCVEALAAGWSVVRDLQAQGLDIGSTNEALVAARAGEPKAIHRLRESGRILGRAIAYCVSLLNPSLVIVGGSLTEAGDHLLLGVRESVYQYSLPLATRDLEVVHAKGDERSGAIGAAQLVIQSTLQADRVNEILRRGKEAQIVAQGVSLT